MNHQKYRIFFQKHIPKEYVEYVVHLFLNNPVRFRIVKPRKTKLGDFRSGIKDEKPQITINNDLNPYSFLITTVHEFAHLITHNKFGRKAATHGVEWKNEYSKLIFPIIEMKQLPADIERVLLNSLVKVKASSCSDVELQRILMKYDIQQNDQLLLEELDKNTIFTLNNKQYKKGDLRRTRFLCQRIESKKEYLIHALAKVKLSINKYE